jgi:hypothetical protein
MMAMPNRTNILKKNRKILYLPMLPTTAMMAKPTDPTLSKTKNQSLLGRLPGNNNNE